MTPHRERWTVDSIEEGVAAVERGDGSLARLPAWLLPAGAREGDVLEVERLAGGAEASLRVALSPAATNEAHRASAAQARGAPGPRPDPGGDIVL